MSAMQAMAMNTPEFFEVFQDPDGLATLIKLMLTSKEKLRAMLDNLEGVEGGKRSVKVK